MRSRARVLRRSLEPGPTPIMNACGLIFSSQKLLNKGWVGRRASLELMIAAPQLVLRIRFGENRIQALPPAYHQPLWTSGVASRRARSSGQRDLDHEWRQ